MSNKITMGILQEILPKKVRPTLTKELLYNINNTFSDPDMMENYRDNIVSYASVMKDGKFKIQQYLDAVRYVSMKMLGSSNNEAYAKAFPDRYAAKLAKHPRKDVASMVSSYNKNKLVNLVFEQTLIPTHVLNADLYQEAINTQASLMRDDDVSPKVRSDAANSLLIHLKPPEATKIELDISVKESDVMKDLREATLILARKQQSMVKEKIINAKDVAQSEILEHNPD